jgi:hypothetical protein
MRQPTGSSGSASEWFQIIKEAWELESLGHEPPGLVVKADPDLWELWRRAQKTGVLLENFDLWLGHLVAMEMVQLNVSVGHQLGLVERVTSIFSDAAIRRCLKCGGELLKRGWREIIKDAQATFPGRRFVCAEHIALPSDDSLKRSFSLEKYLDIFGSERVVIDGRVFHRSEVESEVLKTPFSSSEKWHRELMVVTASEPHDRWVGVVLGVDDSKYVVCRYDVLAGGLCKTCGQESDFADFDLSRALFTEEARSWRFGETLFSDIRNWSVDDTISHLGLQEFYDLSVIRALGLGNLRAFQEIAELSRDEAFCVWSYVSLVRRSGADLLAFDIPGAGNVAVRQEIVRMLQAKGIRLFLDPGSSKRFFSAEDRDLKTTQERYRCSWLRSRGCLAHRLGVFEVLVSPFFETAEGRQVGVRAASFASVGCKSCLRDDCANCDGSGVVDRFSDLVFWGLSLKEYMRKPIRELSTFIPQESVRELLLRLVELGFGDLSLGGTKMVRESPSWFGYETYVADLLRGTIRGDPTELKSLL